jgi:carbon-monoxide dehydrogenase small subunit
MGLYEGKMMNIKFRVNGRQYIFDIEPNKLLINLLREELYLTGTKYGCGIGECGACTVLIDGNPVLSCMTLAIDCDGREIETIEGLSDGEKINMIQESYLDEGAVQCGFCTPGFILTTKALLSEIKTPNENEIREFLKGNICRCTGYVNIIRAVQKAAKKIQ